MTTGVESVHKPLSELGHHHKMSRQWVSLLVLFYFHLWNKNRFKELGTHGPEFDLHHVMDQSALEIFNILCEKVCGSLMYPQLRMSSSFKSNLSLSI